MTAPPSTETPRRHTATPWALFHANGTIAITNPRSHSSKNEIVFWTGFDASHYPKEALANAAFIVTAVNSHASLTARVAELEAELAKSCDDMRFADSDAGCTRAVLADARVKRLEEALRKISDLYVNAPGWAAPAPSHEREYKMHQIARAALDNADGGRGA